MPLAWPATRSVLRNKRFDALDAGRAGPALPADDARSSWPRRCGARAATSGAATASASTCAARCAAACARAATRSGSPAGAGASCRGGSCCCATSRARWSPTRAPTCSSSTCAAGSGPERGGVRVRHAADPRSPARSRSRNPERAIQRAAAAAPDWSSGTRIGDALKAFNDRHGRRGMARGAVVVILSDGWERGDPALVGPRDGAPGAARLPDRLGQPARGRRRVLGAGRRDGGGAAALRRAGQRPQLRGARRGGRGDRAARGDGRGRRSRVRSRPSRPRRSRGPSATPVPGSSVAMPSGYGPSRGNTTPGWVTDRVTTATEDLHLPRLRAPRGAAAPAGRAAAGVLRPRGAQRADRPPGAAAAGSAGRSA